MSKSKQMQKDDEFPKKDIEKILIVYSKKSLNLLLIPLLYPWEGEVPKYLSKISTSHHHLFLHFVFACC